VTGVERRLATADLTTRELDLAAGGAEQVLRVPDRVGEDQIAEARREELDAQRRLPLDVLRAAVLAEHEVALAVGHVVERHRCERLEERDTALGVELVLDAAVR
jgi:hypothetical protein